MVIRIQYVQCYVDFYVFSTFMFVFVLFVFLSLNIDFKTCYLFIVYIDLICFFAFFLSSLGYKYIRSNVKELITSETKIENLFNFRTTIHLITWMFLNLTFIFFILIMFLNLTFIFFILIMFFYKGNWSCIFCSYTCIYFSLFFLYCWNIPI
jgi:hypothetical protein